MITYPSKLQIKRKYLPQNKPKVLTVEEIAKRRELARIKHALKNSITKSDDSEKELSTAIITENKHEVVEPILNDDDIMFIAFGRIYSGTIRRGQEVYVLGPKHDPSKVIDKVCLVSVIFLKI